MYAPHYTVKRVAVFFLNLSLSLLKTEYQMSILRGSARKQMIPDSNKNKKTLFAETKQINCTIFVFYSDHKMQITTKVIKDNDLNYLKDF